MDLRQPFVFTAWQHQWLFITIYVVVVNSLFMVAPIVLSGFCVNLIFDVLLYVVSSFETVFMVKRESWLLYFYCILISCDIY